MRQKKKENCRPCPLKDLLNRAISDIHIVQLSLGFGCSEKHQTVFYFLGSSNSINVLIFSHLNNDETCVVVEKQNNVNKYETLIIKYNQIGRMPI